MQRLIIIILAVMVSLPVIVKSRASRVKSPPAAFSVISSGKFLVRVSGDLRHPGIYEVDANSLTISVINMATPESAHIYLKPNETAQTTVVNGTDIRIRNEHDGSGMISVGLIPAGERMVLGIPLDINALSEADFHRLPGIGAVMAKRIVQYRQIIGGTMSVEDLLAVEGIGKMKYQKIFEYFKQAENEE